MLIFQQIALLIVLATCTSFDPFSHPAPAQQSAFARIGTGVPI